MRARRRERSRATRAVCLGVAAVVGASSARAGGAPPHAKTCFRAHLVGSVLGQSDLGGPRASVAGAIAMKAFDEFEGAILRGEEPSAELREALANALRGSDRAANKKCVEEAEKEMKDTQEKKDVDKFLKMTEGLPEATCKDLAACVTWFEERKDKFEGLLIQREKRGEEKGSTKQGYPGYPTDQVEEEEVDEEQVGDDDESDPRSRQDDEALKDEEDEKEALEQQDSEVPAGDDIPEQDAEVDGFDDKEDDVDTQNDDDKEDDGGSSPPPTDDTSDSAPVTPDTSDSAPVTPDTSDSAPVTPDTSDSAPVTPDTSDSAPVTPDTSDSAPVTPDTSDSAPVTPDTSDSAPVTPDTSASAPVTPDTSASAPPEALSAVLKAPPPPKRLITLRPPLLKRLRMTMPTPPPKILRTPTLKNLRTPRMASLTTTYLRKNLMTDLRTVMLLKKLKKHLRLLRMTLKRPNRRWTPIPKQTRPITLPMKILKQRIQLSVSPVNLTPEWCTSPSLRRLAHTQPMSCIDAVTRQSSYPQRVSTEPSRTNMVKKR
ncbi:hypothetical protein BE221DRAFT_110790 [Ostreococcus tauri]|uniref:Uncharacterized protein n=1 Tax=Ostreococcus tauri TaxID=70448 RepID=A0A1Y5IL55_OSTTA|nr:hypothetical protein BE221DRAFT_110790 [Ostreococcus tauri]